MNHRIELDQSKKLAAWLTSESAQIFLGVAVANAERHEATAVATMMADPVAMIELECPTIKVQDLFREAAKLRLFVKQFEELAGQNFLELTYARRDPDAADADSASES